MIALLLLLAAVPIDHATTDRVDLIEVNHLHDSEGRHVITQTIFYDWSQQDARFHVRAWRLVKSPGQIPQRDWRRGGFVSCWRDMQLMREVRAGQVRETWTMVDPEVLERDILPAEFRRELSQE